MGWFEVRRHQWMGSMCAGIFRAENGTPRSTWCRHTRGGLQTLDVQIRFGVGQ